MGKRKQSTRGHVDFEEVRFRQFVVRNQGMYRILKGEGVFQGQIFKLTTWRSDGLFARLRESGFVVKSLADQVEDLPRVPPAARVGEAVFYISQGHERYSYFDALALVWVPLELEQHKGQPGVWLRSGWVVRRWRNRGVVSYGNVILLRTTGHVRFDTLSETEALLAGYAQCVLVDRPAISVFVEQKHHYVPDIVLPAPHYEVMTRLADKTEQGWKVEKRVWPLARKAYEKLGVQLAVRNHGVQ